MGVDNDEPARPAAGSFSTADDIRDARWVGAGLFVMIVALIVALIVISGAAYPGVELTLFGATITHDQVLLLGVLTAGALGGCIHVATSFSDYVGNNEYKATWQYWYVIRPFIGGCLAAAFYFLLRGGLLSLASPAASDPRQSPSFYGVTAIAFLVGMFSKQATDKLDDVFDTLFKSDKDADRKNGLGDTVPVLKALDPKNTAAGSKDTKVKLSGSNFLKGAGVRVNGTSREADEVAADGTSMTVTLKEADLLNAGMIKIQVENPGTGNLSAELQFEVTPPPPPGGPEGADDSAAEGKIKIPGVLNEAGLVITPANGGQQTATDGASSTGDAQQSTAGSTDTQPATGGSDAQPPASGGGGDGQTTTTGSADPATQPGAGESSSTAEPEPTVGVESSTSRAG